VWENVDSFLKEAVADDMNVVSNRFRREQRLEEFGPDDRRPIKRGSASAKEKKKCESTRGIRILERESRRKDKEIWT